MSKTKKIIIIVSMVLVLGAAAALNILLLDKGQKDENVVATGSFFTTYRENRQETRAAEIAALDEIIALTGTEYEKSRSDAAAEKLKMVELMETEMLIESLLLAKGYEDVAVNMGIYSGNVNIMVKSDALTREDTAIIYGVLVTEANIAPEMVKFIEV